MQKTMATAFSPLGGPLEERIPCKAACPLKIDVHAAVILSKAGKTNEARRQLTKKNPLPLTVSYLCHKPCENACAEGIPCEILHGQDGSYGLDFRGSHEAAQDNDGNGTVTLNVSDGTDWRLAPEIFDGAAEARPPRVAIAGSSPVALGAAFYLTQAGCQAAVLDTVEQTGGWLMNSVASMTLPEEAIKEDIRRLREMGIRFYLVDRRGRQRLLENFRDEGYDALLIVPSFFDPKRNEALTDERCKGIIDLGAFVRAVSSGKTILPEETVIMGSGREVLAAGALCAKHSSGHITIVLHDSDTHHSGVAHGEIEAIRSRKVDVLLADCCGAVAIPGVGGERCGISGLSEDSSLPADVIVLDGSLRPLPARSSRSVNFTLSRHLPIAVEPETMLTDTPGIFCAEPLAPVNRSIVHDLARGRRAAEIVYRYLKNTDLEENRPKTAGISIEEIEGTPCAECLKHLAVQDASCNLCLECVEACPTGALYAAGEDGLPLRRPRPANPEASKPVLALDTHLCSKCGACTRACPHGALELRILHRPAVSRREIEKTAAPAMTEDITAVSVGP